MSTKTKAQVQTAETVEPGSGNVFADLGLPDPDERQLRVQLAIPCLSGCHTHPLPVVC